MWLKGKVYIVRWCLFIHELNIKKMDTWMLRCILIMISISLSVTIRLILWIKTLEAKLHWGHWDILGALIYKIIRLIVGRSRCNHNLPPSHLITAIALFLFVIFLNCASLLHVEQEASLGWLCVMVRRPCTKSPQPLIRDGHTLILSLYWTYIIIIIIK